MSYNFYNKKFSPAPTTFENDLDTLINSSTHTYLLAEREETPAETTARKELWDKFKARSSSGYATAMAVLSFLGIVSVVSFLALLISYVTYGKPEVCFFMIVSIVFIAAVCCCAGWVHSVVKNQFYIDVSNFNDEYFQFRIMPDKKLYVVGGANFDEKGETLAMNFITEMEPIYSDLIIMDSITSIKQVKEGAVIKGVANFRTYKINGAAKLYIQMNKKQQMTIYLQNGIFPQELLEKISDNYNVPITD